MSKTFPLLVTMLVLGCGSSSDDAGSTTPDSSSTDTAVADDTGSSAEDSSSPVDTGSLADATDTGVDPFGAYPAGPYGNKVGDVMANLQWEGYVNTLADALSNTKPYVASTSMDKLRRDAKKGYALVHVSEFY